MNAPEMAVPLWIASAIGTALLSAIGVLAAVIKWLSTQRETDRKELTAAKDKAEEGRLADLKASAALVRETHERVLPVLERVAREMQIRNDRALHRRSSSRGEDSDPPSALEDTATRLRRALVEIEGGNPDKVPQ